MELGSILRVCYSNIFVASAYNNPDSDGAVVVQKEIGDNLIILTIFGMQI